VLGEPRLTLPWSAGVIGELEPISDRLVIALTGDRVLRVDPTLISPTSGLYTPSPGLTVFLDHVYDPELWRRTEGVTPLRTSGLVHEPPPPSVFVLGRTLWLQGGQGPPQRILSAGPDRWMGRPSWSPDGAMFAVSVNGSDSASSALVVFSRTGQALHQAPARGDRPTWSPDGQWLAFTHTDDVTGPQVWVMRPDGSGATGITSLRWGSRASITERAEMQEISCSADRPPKRTTTRRLAVMPSTAPGRSPR